MIGSPHFYFMKSRREKERVFDSGSTATYCHTTPVLEFEERDRPGHEEVRVPATADNADGKGNRR